MLAVAVLPALAGGWMAGRQSGSVQPVRCTALGGLAGGLAGCVTFCLWGAAAGGLLSSIRQPAQVDLIAGIILKTLEMFLVLFLGGTGLGAAGGWISRVGRPSRPDVFSKADPQMALNASITAVPASIVAAALAAASFPHLVDTLGAQASQTVPFQAALSMPLAVALLLVLISQWILTYVVPHEAAQAEHRCGLDEVKMGAFVGIGAAPVLAGLLFLIRAPLINSILVWITLISSGALSMISLNTLRRQILPKRRTFPPPQSGQKKAEAIWFGTISKSIGPRLVVLCAGCGLVMVLPIYVCVLSVLVNLALVPTLPANGELLTQAAGKIFLTQALVSVGTITAAILALSGIYLFYLQLGRSFSRRTVPESID
jgi:hypothetical protein